MSRESFIIISRIATLSAFLVFLLFYTRKNLWKTKFRWVGVLLLVSVSFDVLCEILYNNKVNPNIAINLWILFEAIFYTFFCYAYLKSKKIRITFLILISIFFCFGLFNFFFLEGPTILNSYTRSLACFIMVLFSIYLFFQLLVDLPTAKLTRFPMFWVSAAVLLYFSGTFILNISIGYLVNTLNSNLIFFWIFLLVLNFVKNILLGIGSYYKLKSIPSV